MRVLVIDGDSAWDVPPVVALQSEGLTVEFAQDGEEGVSLAKLYDFDVIMIERQLPDITGFEVLRQIRRANIKTPVLILSAMAEISDIVRLLEAGADDYLTKPCDSRELIARIHALVRRSNGLAQSIITIGNLAINLATRTVKVSGEPVYLTGKEYALVELLALRKGHTQSKEAIMNHLYGGRDEPELKIIDVFICKLRKKMANFKAHPIETVWGRGYVLRDADSKPASMAAEVADLADDPPTGFVPNITANSFRKQRKDAEKNAKVAAVHILIPAT